MEDKPLEIVEADQKSWKMNVLEMMEDALEIMEDDQKSWKMNYPRNDRRCPGNNGR
jgi:hypothetical protein